ncbi:MAG: DUF1638 domain-containing protein, partial [Planctomycetes bacterium]|nr:DUF1638 domain-containing protein [Planctomycetota bacterium]
MAAAVEAEGFADVAVSTFPAHCNRPRAAWDALLSIAAGERNGNPTQLICGPCGDVPESYPQAHGRFHVLKVERCCHLFAGRTIVDGLLDEGAYPLIPGWLAHWQDYVDPSAPDPERSRAFRGESATSLVLLDTGVDASSPELLRDLAERADLPFRVIPVGLEYFRLLLTRIVLAWRLERDRDTSAAALADANRRSAGYATVVDLIGGLTRIMTEAEAIEHIFDVFTALFAPASMVYIPLLDGRPGRIRARPAAPPESDATAGPLAGSADD